MARHLKRISEYLEIESALLRTQARQARLFDHAGNRGTKAEEAIVEWLRERLGPHYTVSSGEVIDSYPDDVKMSRQIDAVVYRDDSDTRRLTFPSGIRVVPVEAVAAFIEIKLAGEGDDVLRGEEWAADLGRLRLRPGAGGNIPIELVNPDRVAILEMVTDKDVENGIGLDDSRLAPNRPTFAVFAFESRRGIDQLAHAFRRSMRLDTVCALDGGCFARDRSTGEIHRCEPAGTLPMFLDTLRTATERHDRTFRYLRCDLGPYTPYTPQVWRTGATSERE